MEFKIDINQTIFHMAVIKENVELIKFLLQNDTLDINKLSILW